MAARPGGGQDELSRTLLELRRAAGLSTRQVGGLTGFSQAKVSRVERGINVPTEADVVELADAYDAPDPIRRRLLVLARDVRAEHRPVVMARGKGRPGLFQERLARIEAASHHIRAFAPTAVPGLLQTERYMREVVTARELSLDKVTEFVAGRQRRQRLLAEPGRQFTIVTTPGALDWRMGTEADMAEQVDHIAACTRLPTARVGIVPRGTRARRVVLNGWDIYDERAVSYGSAEATAILTERRDVDRYMEMFAMVEAMAVFGEQARELLTEIADCYRARADLTRGDEPSPGTR